MRALRAASLLALLGLVGACGNANNGETPMPPVEDASGEVGIDGSAGAAGTSNEAGVDASKDALPEGASGAGGTDSGPKPDVEEAGYDAPPEAAPDAKPKAGCITGTFNPYFGILHDHTSYSDGEKKPSDAFAWARDVAGLDILVVTDHLEQVMIPTRWSDCKNQADQANAPGTFLAACGYEYATFSTPPISTGHNNIFFNSSLMDPSKWDVQDVYDSLAGCSTCIGQYNHPGDDATMTWNDFALVPAAEDKMRLFEFNGGGPVWDLFFQALNNGWHVSPALNQDNHSADWGTKNDHRSGYFMASLDRPSLWDAMKNRRSFATWDKNASIRMMADQDCWMGSILSGYDSAEISLEATDSDTGDGFTQIELFGSSKQLLGTVDCQSKTTCSGKVTINGAAAKFVIAKATQQDGDTLIGAPIWFNP
ncbi:MAG: hypothetical protein HY898_12220 [Deltaproteobacteria bacterium]|nr:hypothetical protein [Deltaproteobacteria bacterium]